MILPGKTLGMLGGGQLGRFFTVAARSLGYRVVVLDPDTGSPAGRMADEHLHAAYTDAWALEQMASGCAVLSTEFENIPAESLRRLAKHRPVRPGAEALEQTQNRIREKQMLKAAGLETVPYAEIQGLDDLPSALSSVQLPAILKRAALGYDGKGQVTVATPEAAQEAFEYLGKVPCVLEQRVDLACEISVIQARAASGQTCCFPVAENRHRDGILHMSVVPANIDTDIRAQAEAAAAAIATYLDYVGLLAVEFFVTRDGQLLVNEVAPRPHNSGHFTLDACVTSQFEQQVRAICDLPLGATDLLRPAVMVNLLGDLWAKGMPDWTLLLANPHVKLHLYGKEEARPGRKMGHFTVLADDVATALHQAEQLYQQLCEQAGS